jgi:methylated-DNA-[protein]-cysteine S-methyltransferase
MTDIYTEKIGNTWFGVAFKDKTILGTTFANNEKNALKGLSEAVHRDIFKQTQKQTEFAKQVIHTLKNIYDGKNGPQNLKIKSKHISKYAMKVIETVSKVPTGYVTSYGQVAKTAGGGPRAVGQIMAKNPFAPLCPCHRIVKSDLTLGGYGGGLNVKLAFLKREKRGYTSEKEIPIDGKKLLVFPVERAIKKAETT